MPNDVLTGGGFSAAGTPSPSEREATMSRKRKGPVMGYKADGSVAVFDPDHPDLGEDGELPAGWSDHPGVIEDEKLRTAESITARAVRNPSEARPPITAENAPPAAQSALKRYPTEAEPGASPTMPITDAATGEPERRRPGRPRKQPQDGDPLPVELRGGHERADWHDQEHPGGDPSLDKPPST